MHIGDIIMIKKDTIQPQQWHTWNQTRQRHLQVPEDVWKKPEGPQEPTTTSRAYGEGQRLHGLLSSSALLGPMLKISPLIHNLLAPAPIINKNDIINEFFQQ